MASFSTDTLTILVLISLSWTGLISIVIFFFVLYKLCSKHGPSITVDPIQKHSASVISDNYSPRSASPVSNRTPIPNVDQHKKSGQQQYFHDTANVVNERPNSSYNNNNKKKFQQQKYIRDEYDDTTTRDEYRTYNQSLEKRQHQPYRPITNVTAIDRCTPYPKNILAREEMMKKNRILMDNKY